MTYEMCPMPDETELTWFFEVEPIYKLDEELVICYQTKTADGLHAKIAFHRLINSMSIVVYLNEDVIFDYYCERIKNIRLVDRESVKTIISDVDTDTLSGEVWMQISPGFHVKSHLFDNS